MPIQDKIEGAKDNKFLGLKGIYRKGKQACMEKFGHSKRVAESAEFRTAVDHTKLLKGAYATITAGVSSIAGAVEGVKISMNTLYESYTALSKALPDCALSRALTGISSGFKDTIPYGDAFVSEVRTNIIPVFDKLTRFAIEEMDAKKKEYNSLRFEHDEVKHSLDKSLSKPAKAGRQEKVKRLQKDYSALHERYLNFQIDYMYRAGFLEMIIQRDAGLAIMRLSKELFNWCGQLYRILSAQSGIVSSTEAALSAMPPPKLASVPMASPEAQRQPTPQTQNYNNDNPNQPQTGFGY